MLLIISSVIIKLILIASVGFILYKKSIINESILDFLTFLVVHITLPALFFSHLVQDAPIVLSHSFLKFFVLSFLLFVIGALLGFLLSLIRKHDRTREMVCLTGLQNAGYIPMNMAVFLFSGHIREEFFVYTFLYLLGFNIIMWSIGSFLIFKKKGQKINIISLLSPPIIGTLLALTVIYLRLDPYIPSVLLSPTRMLGDTSFVFSMLILGAWLAKVDLHGLFSRAKVIISITIIKLLIVPCIILCTLIYFKLSSLLGLFIILQAAMPCAASLPIVFKIRKGDSIFASQAIFITHIISILTVPLWIGLYIHFSGYQF